MPQYVIEVLGAQRHCMRGHMKLHPEADVYIRSRCSKYTKGPRTRVGSFVRGCHARRKGAIAHNAVATAPVGIYTVKEKQVGHTLLEYHASNKRFAVDECWLQHRLSSTNLREVAENPFTSIFTFLYLCINVKNYIVRSVYLRMLYRNTPEHSTLVKAV